MILNKEGIIQKANHPVSTLLGREKMAGQDIRSLVGPPDIGRIDQVFQIVGINNQEHIFEIPLKHHSGEIINTRILASAVKNDNGSTSDVIFTLQKKQGKEDSDSNPDPSQIVEELRWLSDQGRALLAIDNWDDLLLQAGEAFLEITKPAIVLVLTQIDEDTLRLEGIHGLANGALEKVNTMIGRSLLKAQQFVIEDRFKEIYNKRRLTHHPGGLVNFAINQVPERISKKIESIFNIHDVYTIGLEGNHSVLGCIYILTQMPGQKLPVDLIESYTFQLALALEKNSFARNLIESEKRFQTIFEYAPDAYYVNDLKGNIVAGNLAAEKIVGRPREELIGRNMRELGLLSKEHLPRAGKMLVDNLRGKSTGPDWFPLKRSDGSVVDVEITTHPVTLDDQALVLGIARDVSERNVIEQNLISAHENLKRVLEGIDAHVYVSDMKTFEILYMNQKMINDFGGDFTGGVCHEVFCGNQEKCAACTNDQLVGDDGAPGEAVVWEGKNNITGRWYRNYDRAIHWQDQKVVRLQIAVDITEQINTSRELEESEKRFRSLFESSGNALMTIHPPAWMFTSGNSALVELFGFDNEQEFLSCTPWDISPEYQPDGELSQTKAMEMIEISLDQGWNHFNWTHRKKNGQEFPAMVRLKRVDLDQEYFVQATVIDITDRVTAERILQEQMQNLKIINDLNTAANRGQKLQDVFGLFSEEIKKIFPVIDTHIYLLDGEHQSLTVELIAPVPRLKKIVEGSIGIDLPSSVNIALDESPNFLELLKSSTARVITDIEIIRGLMKELIAAILGSGTAGKKLSRISSMIFDRANIQSMAVVPLISGNRIIGLADIISKEPITNSALGWLSTAADQLSGIIQRVQAEADREESIQELELINQAFVAGSRLDDPDEICNFLADVAHGVNPDCYMMVTLLDPDLQAIRVRALRGLGGLSDKVTKLMGRKPQEIHVDISQYNQPDDLKRKFTSGKLEEIPGGIYDITRGSLPQTLCRAIEKLLGIEKMYIIGFGIRGESTGGLVIGLKDKGLVKSKGALETISNHFAEIFEKRRAQEEILERKRHLEALRSVELEITSTLDLEALLHSIAAKAAEIVNAAASGFCVYNVDKNHLDYFAYTGFDRLPENRIIQPGEGLSGRVWELQETIIVENYASWPDRLENWEKIGNYFLAGIPVCWGDESLGVLEIAMPVDKRLSPADISLLESFAVQAAIAIKNAQLFSGEKQKRKEAETMREVGMMVNSHLERSELLDSILIALGKVVPYHSASIQLIDGEYVVIEAFRGAMSSDEVIGKKFLISANALAGPVLKEKKNVILDDVSDNPSWIRGPETVGINSWLAVPLQVKGKCIGLLTLDHKNKAQYQERDAQLALNFASQAAIALENSSLFEDAKKRMYKIESLRQIDLAISGSVDLEITMNVLVRQLISSLDVDAATVLIFNDRLKTLEYIAGHGFVTDSLRYTSLRMGEGLAGKAAQKREMVYMRDISSEETSLQKSPQLRNENFVSYVAVPLIAKGDIVGVLEVFHRSVLDPDNEWLNFLEALAGQAAIAIDRLNLFMSLEESNLDLLSAYEATIEGWAKAIELRDRETEGHSRRVVDLTLRLAMRMGISGEELLNIRRGALLHDIGKMAVPDGILLKPGKLTESEWEIMKEHPAHAINMLSQIEYLQPALDIPYCHHERWDGTGYPQGLAGEMIPLAARIFAVVDVWDALQSDRPYRPAWTEEEAIHHVRENSGSHFDPDVVSEFLEMIKTSQGE